MVREMVADPALADDLAQDTLEVGLRHDLGAVQNIKRWFRGVAKNLLRQSYRSKARRVSREQRVASEGEQASPPLNELTERVEIQQRVASAVLDLPLEQRRILILRFYEQQTVGQIAASLGISKSAAGLRIHRAKSMLRGQLQASLGGDWRLLAAPISSGLGKIGLATLPTTLLAMNKFAKTAAVIAIGLLCSLPFLSNKERDSIVTDRESAVALEPESKPNQDSGVDVSSLVPGVESTDHLRTQERSGYSVKLVGPDGKPVIDAEVENYLAPSGIQFENLNYYFDLYHPPQYPVLSGLTDEFGVAFLPYANPPVKGYIFAKREGHVMRGFPIEQFGNVEGNVVRIGPLELEPNAGHCWLQFREEDGGYVSNLEVDLILLELDSGFEPRLSPPGTMTRQSARTDANGLVKFSSAPRGKAHLQIGARRHVHWTREVELLDAKPDQPTQVVISRGESIRVRVLNEQGSPVANAGIHYTTYDWHEQPREMRPGSVFWRGDTDQNGELLVEGLVKGQGHRIVAVDGDFWAESNRMEVGDEITLQLPRTSEWSGSFELADGTPASGAKLAIVDFHRRRNTPDRIVDVDQDGKFSVRLPHGMYFYEVIHSTGSIHVDQPIVLEEDVHSNPVTLENGPEFHLQVINQVTKVPIPGTRAYFARVPEHIASQDPNNTETYFHSFRSKELDMLFKDGNYSGRKLAPGTYTIQVNAIGFTGREYSLNVQKGEPNTHIIELTPITTLELLAINSSGTPQPSWSLMAVPENAVPSWQLNTGQSPKQSEYQYTNGAGVATFERLQPGSWRIESGLRQHFGWEFGKVELKPGKNRHTLVLPNSINAEFSVIAGTTPVEGAKIDLRWHFPKESKRVRNYPLMGKSNQDGIAVIKKLAPGDYTMDVHAPGLLPRRERITLGMNHQRVDVHYQGNRVAGIVHDARAQTKVVLFHISKPDLWGEDIANTLQAMFAKKPGGGISSFRQPGGSYVKADLDQSGQFEFPQVPNGEYFIFATIPEEVPPNPTPISVKDADVTQLELAEPQSCRLKVDITGLNVIQKTYPKARILLWAEYEGIPRYVVQNFRKNLRQTLKNLVPGDCTLTFEYRNPQADPRIKKTVTREVQLSVDQTVEIAIDVNDF